MIGVVEAFEVLRGDFLPAPLLTWGPRLPHPPERVLGTGWHIANGVRGTIGDVDQNALERILKT